MKKGLRVVALSLIAACALCAVGCKKDPATTRGETLSYEGISLSECVRLGAYEGLTVTLTADTDKESAVWSAVRNGSEILSYPEDAVAYYIAQTEARYGYYAEKNGVSKKEAMEAVGMTEEKIEAEAKALVADDLIVRAVQADAGIALTEDEKTRLFDKYANKYVQDFGYDREYVKENLSELIYESMLYDKTTEYLILKNTFVN